jgi:hypothetical protein
MRFPAPAPLFALAILAACSSDLTLPGGPSDGPAPDQLRIVDGDGQRAQTGELLADPLVVEVVDSGRAPVPGTPVEFSFVGDPPGAVLQPSSAETDSSGQVSAFVQLGETSGKQEIVARVAGTASPELSASFTVTAVDAKGTDGGGKGRGGGGHGHGDDDED